MVCRVPCLALLFALVSCAGLAPGRPEPRRAWSRSPVAERARCRIEDDRLRCGGRSSALAELGLVLPLRASAPRVQGGLWLLDAERTLIRIDTRGRVTGREHTDDDALFTSAEFVCTLAVSSRLRCRVDRHDDGGCGLAAVLEPPVELDYWFASVRARADILCGTDPEGVLLCVRLTRPCQRGCLRFPSCAAALRCIDACLPHQTSILARRLDALEFRPSPSSFLPAAVTHAHAREQGGYAAAHARPR
jgi:hypothetical protein